MYRVGRILLFEKRLVVDVEVTNEDGILKT